MKELKVCHAYHVIGARKKIIRVSVYISIDNVFIRANIVPFPSDDYQNCNCIFLNLSHLKATVLT